MGYLSNVYVCSTECIFCVQVLTGTVWKRTRAYRPTLHRTACLPNHRSVPAVSCTTVSLLYWSQFSMATRGYAVSFFRISVHHFFSERGGLAWWLLFLS